MREGSPPVDAAGDDDGSALLLEPHPDLRVASILAAASSWQWDAFALEAATGGRPLSTLAAHLIRGAGLVPALGLNAVALGRWLVAIEAGYGDNPFHNRVHAADVLQTMHVVLTRGGLLEVLQRDPLVHLAALLGVSNDFLVATSDELALTYNDVSPQENMHASAALKLLLQERYDFLAAVPPAASRRLRRLLIKAVLATDMKQHFSLMAAFQALLAELARHGPALLPRSQELVLQVALKFADVGHLMAHWDVHREWVGLLEEEMYRQGDRERALGLPVSPLMDRAQPGAAWSQAGFLTVVVLPLLHAWTTLLPAAGPLLYAAMSNRAQWEGEAIAAKAKAKAEALEAELGAAAAAAGAPGPAAAGGAKEGACGAPRKHAAPAGAR
ncbi:MAG: 3'5'-cyclic nucleotide phosphodiesterase [Monoraphidium minutum]|nr:MAG: 3'5'-cyclic nucleotide phosphodiesterase [Monoraphidium minutum]